MKLKYILNTPVQYGFIIQIWAGAAETPGDQPVSDHLEPARTQRQAKAQSVRDRQEGQLGG